MRACLAALPLLIIVTPTLAQDLPTRKSGLWEMKMTMEGGAMPAQAMQHCVDAATDRQLNAVGAGMRAESCQKHDVQRSGATLTINAVCKLGGTTTTSSTVVTGSFDSAYTMRMVSKREGGPAVPGMPAETRMTIEAKWTGACKADQKPGDIIMANGMKMNVNDLQGAAGGMKK